MYQAGVPPRYMRICEPFGPEQRQGLWLYHVIEPERWAAMCARVSGALSGGIYAGQDSHFYGHRKILKPDHLNWEEYALLLLHSMPEVTAEHYRNKIAVYLQWYKKKACTPFHKRSMAISDRAIFRRGDGSAKYY